jgi:hypothetical protein
VAESGVGGTEEHMTESNCDPHKGKVTLYPHGGEREWSTEQRDVWKGDLGVEVVPISSLAEARAELDKIVNGFPTEELDAADPLWRTRGPQAAMQAAAARALNALDGVSRG